MKKVLSQALAIILVTTMALSFSGCGDKTTSTGEVDSQSTNTLRKEMPEIEEISSPSSQSSETESKSEGTSSEASTSSKPAVSKPDKKPVTKPSEIVNKVKSINIGEPITDKPTTKPVNPDNNIDEEAYQMFLKAYNKTQQNRQISMAATVNQKEGTYVVESKLMIKAIMTDTMLTFNMNISTKLDGAAMSISTYYDGQYAYADIAVDGESIKGKSLAPYSQIKDLLKEQEVVDFDRSMIKSIEKVSTENGLMFNIVTYDYLNQEEKSTVKVNSNGYIESVITKGVDISCEVIYDYNPVVIDVPNDLDEYILFDNPVSSEQQFN